MPLSNDVLMSLVSAGIFADHVFFIISVGRGSKEHVVDLLELIIFSTLNQHRLNILCRPMRELDLLSRSVKWSVVIVSVSAGHQELREGIGLTHIWTN